MGRHRGTVLGALVAVGIFPPLSGTAFAQAWLPPKGEAILTLGWSYNWAPYHLDYLGNISSPGDMLFHIVISDLTYGVTDRFAVGANLPFVVSKYGGNTPHAPRPGAQPYDDGTWNRTFTDFRTEVRFRATNGPLAVTPMAAVVVPSHLYEYIGHSAPGRKLREGQFGVNVGRTLDPILSRAYFQARYVYVVTQKVAGIRPNRSELSADLGYFVTNSFTASAFGGYTRTHNGWRAPIDVPPSTSPNFQYHDQLRKGESVRLGGGLSYALTGSISVGVIGFKTLWGRSDFNMTGVALSVSYGFSPAQIMKRRKGPKA